MLGLRNFGLIKNTCLEISSELSRLFGIVLFSNFLKFQSLISSEMVGDAIERGNNEGLGAGNS